MTTETTTTPATFTVTFTVTPIMPGIGYRGTTETIRVTENHERLAFNIGLCKAMSAAGWAAYGYGTVEVKHVETGRTWTISAEEAK